ncbi:MAG: hypothetical protein KF760_20650 [Candidatus Eremiobacteraeota bacterium]|nr:hypothetical protein [Candidatus Eremiobacteraeota bacterium]MCW5870450.1 hypothetical protein [Candidatus Eremiobacteraeota bacterium]
MVTRVLVVLVVFVGALSRVLWLDCLPGVNGDEPWVAIQAYRFTHGLPATIHINPGDRPQFSPCLWAVHLLFSLTGTTDFWYLRVPTVLASLVACLVVWRGWGKLLGPAAGWVALLLWSLPAEIMFSRFGWDPSLMTMCVALAGAAALHGSLLLIVAALIFGLLNHPFFAIATPFVALLWLAENKPGWLKPALLLAQVGGWGAVLLTYWIGHPLGAPEPDRVNFSRFCAGVPDLLSGQATLAYLVDPAQHAVGTALSYLLGSALVLALNWIPWRDLRAENGSREGSVGRPAAKRLLACLGGGLWLSLCGLFLTLGTQGIVPPGERNSLMLVALLVSWLLTRLTPRKLAPVTLALCFAGLALCSRDYFYSLRVNGNRSHRAFMCAPEEPHRTAFRQASQWLAPGGVIVTDDWHNFQPVTYLALPYGITVLHVSDPRVADLRRDLLGGCVLVAHSYGPVMQAAVHLGLPLRHLTIPQAGGREVLEVIALERR